MVWGQRQMIRKMKECDLLGNVQEVYRHNASVEIRENSFKGPILI